MSRLFYSYLKVGLFNDMTQALGSSCFSLFILFFVYFFHSESSSPQTSILFTTGVVASMHLLNIQTIYQEDDNDGTADEWRSKGINGNFFYYLVRLSTSFMAFVLPIFVLSSSIILEIYQGKISLIIYLNFFLYLISLLFCVSFVSIILTLSKSMSHKLSAIFFYVPFWIPSFIYYVGSSLGPQSTSLILFAMVLLHGGLYFLLIGFFEPIKEMFNYYHFENHPI